MKILAAVKRWLIAKWRCWTRYDLKGDLQMQERAARQDIRSAIEDWLVGTDDLFE